MLFPPWFITELLDYIYLKPNSNLSCIKLKIELTAQLIIIYHSEESIFFQIIKRFQGMVLQMKYAILSFHQEWGIFTYTHMILKCTHNFNYLESRKFLSSWRNKYLCFMLAYLIGFLNVQILVFTSCSFMCEFFGKWF